MTSNPTAEMAAIRARARDRLFGGRVYDDIPDDKDLEFDANRMVRPYCIISQGIPVPTGRDRSLMGEEQQPFIVPVTFECWSAARAISEAMVGDATTLFLGWTPVEGNSAPLSLRGGGSFQDRSNSGRPSRFMNSVNWAMIVNLSIDPEFDPQTA